MPKNAFSESDERLLSTIASSLGVALENARLFDETKHLLAETEQRNAELAVVNEISAALSKKLEYEAIIDAVGDKVSEVLGTQDLTIAILDEESGLIHLPYWTENGVRDREVPPMELGQGLTSRVISTRVPVRTGSMAEAAELGGLMTGDLDAAVQQSYLGVPIPGGEGVIGVLALTKLPTQRVFRRRCAARLNDRFGHGRGSRERATFRRDQTPPDRDERARGRARDHQQRSARPRGAPRNAGDV